jgi:Glycosyl hydrolases family 15
MDGSGQTFADYIEGPHLCPDGRDCRRSHYLATELIGGIRNWDYRFCWLRDATFTLLGLMHLGYFDEARAWRDWLLRAVAGSPQQVQIVYGVGGEGWCPR